MMSEPVQFTYTLPSDNEVEVNATVAPGRPELRPSLNHPGEPAEGPDIEINDCFLKDTNDNNPDTPFDPDGLFFRRRDGKFVDIIADMEEYAWEKYRDQ